MAEVTAEQAGAIISTSYGTIHRRANDGDLSVRREGKNNKLWVDVDSLRLLADKYNYHFDEQLAAQYTGQVKA